MGTQSATHIEEFFINCYCQLKKYDCLDIDNIDCVSQDIVLL